MTVIDRQKPFLSIKATCEVTGLSQRFLREGCKRGDVPHIMTGSKYLVNVPLLLHRLNEQSESKGVNVK